MKISFKWLQTYIPHLDNYNIKDIFNALENIGYEVELIKYVLDDVILEVKFPYDKQNAFSLSCIIFINFLQVLIVTLSNPSSSKVHTFFMVKLLNWPT